MQHGAVAAVVIRGATGSAAALLNGAYEPTEELHDGRAVYTKTDGSMWIEYHADAGGHALHDAHVWMVKPLRHVERRRAT